MRIKNFSRIARLIKKNGVGFIKLYFKSEIEFGDLSKKFDGEITINFSDGKNYLGSLKINPRFVYSEVSHNKKKKDDRNRAGTIEYFGISTNIPRYNKKLKIKLIFLEEIWPFFCGKCYIYEKV